jgi:hypothetical protein
MNSMKKAWKYWIEAIAVLLVFLSASWIVQGNDWFVLKVFAPKLENTRRMNFENSRAFNQGMVQELENMQFEYTKSTDEKAKAALASVILHRASGYNLNDTTVSDGLRKFINELKIKYK